MLQLRDQDTLFQRVCLVIWFHVYSFTYDFFSTITSLKLQIRSFGVFWYLFCAIKKVSAPNWQANGLDLVRQNENRALIEHEVSRKMETNIVEFNDKMLDDAYFICIKYKLDRKCCCM